ncbi:heme peroxidase, partial [Zopfia rhizophila CBS 207.26]
SAFHYPDALTSRLEHLLVDTDGAFRSGFKDAITPCSNYVSGSQNFGRQTSAQWLRVAFHDFVTAHVDEGTGGMDSSISMETLRAEDSGSAFNDTFAWFVPFIDARTSAADLLATSIVLSLGNCGGLHVPLRGGRIDAHEPGPFGVPEPESDLEETLEFFANAGFNAQDAIGLTACGHSLGRIHHGGFPQVVPESAVSPNNTAGGINLDTTPTKFDVNVVTEYLEWKGQRGGPLVTSDNVTVRSDLRLYESDGNATMKALGQSEEYFARACKRLFERMINTVPKEVGLSEVVEPAVVKPVNVSFDIANNGKVVLRGAIRLLMPTAESAPEKIEVSLSSNAKTTPSTVSALPETGYSVFGNTTFYPFDLTLPLTEQSPPNTAVLMVKPQSSSIPEAKFTLNPTLFFVPSFSTLDGNTLNIAVALLSSST